MDSQGNELTEAQQRRYKHVAPELRDEDASASFFCKPSMTIFFFIMSM